MDHEHVLSLLRSGDYEAALDVIDTALNEDFLLIILQADIRIQLDQHRKALQLFNRAISELNNLKAGDLPMEGAKDILRSKVHCRIAKVLDTLGNTKDAFHQLRAAIQHTPDDVHVLEFYKVFVQTRMPTEKLPSASNNQPDEMTEQLLKAVEHDWALHCFIRDGGFLT